MSELENEKKVPFAEEFWKEDGGRKWVELIDATESSLHAFSEKLLERADISAAEIVLDVGCGGGVNSIEIANRVSSGGSVIGVDISATILAVANERGKHISNLKFEEGDAATINLGKGVFNLIFSRFGVMFFSEPIKAFTHLRNALKPSGRIVFLCWRTFEENPWMQEPVQAVFEIIPPKGPPPDPDAPGPFSLGNRGKIEFLMKNSGFKSVTIEALDVGMTMGGLEDTVDYFTRMGPAALVIADADAEQKVAARNAIRDVLEKYQSDDGVISKGAAWIVTAR